VPQAPQLLGSVRVSEHVLPHSVRSPQLATQDPCTQRLAGRHSTAHPPQLLGSVSKSISAPRQVPYGAGGVNGVHAPLRQTSPLGQLLPSAPQLSLLFEYEMQSPKTIA
jgi:hypothetical protein